MATFINLTPEEEKERRDTLTKILGVQFKPRSWFWMQVYFEAFIALWYAFQSDYEKLCHKMDVAGFVWSDTHSDFDELLAETGKISTYFGLSRIPASIPVQHYRASFIEALWQEKKISHSFYMGLRFGITYPNSVIAKGELNHE